MPTSFPCSERMIRSMRIVSGSKRKLSIPSLFRKNSIVSSDAESIWNPVSQFTSIVCDSSRTRSSTKAIRNGQQEYPHAMNGSKQFHASRTRSMNDAFTLNHNLLIRSVNIHVIYMNA